MLSKRLLLSVFICMLGGLSTNSTLSSPLGRTSEGNSIDNSHRPTVRAYRIAAPPKLDGLVNELFWAEMEPATNFIQQEPDAGLPATEQTEVRIAFDDKDLYLGIICFDRQPENIVVTQNRRDANLADTDSIEILLDTFNDKQNAVVFGTSPTGIEYDGQVSKAGQTRGSGGTNVRAGGASGNSGAQRGGASAFNLNWDAVWWVRAQITERGWEAEVRIPFRTLRYRPGSEQVWGLNLKRNLRRRNEQSFWSPLSRAFEFHQIDLAGRLEGLELLTHRNLKLLPYVLGGFKQDYSIDNDPTKSQHTAGLDIKYSLTPSLTLDATFNTDFAQVEVDEEQINLTRFDLFFPEKRSFFLENSGTFEFGSPREVEIFFSRRIGIDESGVQVPIDGGLRLSGKAGQFNIGLLSMQTRKVSGLTPANNFSAARVSREFGRRSSLGGIAVSRQATSSRFSLDRPSYNRTMGVDANLGFGRYANLFSYFAKSLTPGRNSSNQAVASTFDYEDQHHGIDLAYQEVGRNFNPEVGFVRRRGYRKPSFAYRYTYTLEGKRLRNISSHFTWEGWHTIAREGQPRGKESGFEHYHFDTRWQNGSRLGIAWNRNFERIDKQFEIFPGVLVSPGGYQYSEIVGNFNFNPSAVIFGGGNIAIGDFYGGTIRNLNLNGGYRIGYRYTFTLSYVRNFVRLPEGDFNTDLVGYRFNWSLTPKSYFQSFVQYNSRTHQVGINARLGLLSTSSTGLYVVYNSRVATIDYLDPHEQDRRTLSRALFLKFNYLFDF